MRTRGVDFIHGVFDFRVRSDVRDQGGDELATSKISPTKRFSDEIWTRIQKIQLFDVNFEKIFSNRKSKRWCSSWSCRKRRFGLCPASLHRDAYRAPWQFWNFFNFEPNFDRENDFQTTFWSKFMILLNIFAQRRHGRHRINSCGSDFPCPVARSRPCSKLRWPRGNRYRSCPIRTGKRWTHRRKRYPSSSFRRRRKSVGRADRRFRGWC